MKTERPCNADLMFASGYLIGGADAAKERGHAWTSEILEGVACWLTKVATSGEDVPMGVYIAHRQGKAEAPHDED